MKFVLENFYPNKNIYLESFRMRFKLTIENPDLHWQDFKELIIGNTNSKEILKTCYKQSKQRKRLGFGKTS